MTYDEGLAERLRDLLPAATEKRIFGSVGWMERGHLVVGVWQDDLIARVPPADTAAALKERGVKPFTAGKKGASMKDCSPALTCSGTSNHVTVGTGSGPKHPDRRATTMSGVHQRIRRHHAPHGKKCAASIVQVALHEPLIRIDAAVAQERPTPPRRLDLLEVAVHDEDLLLLSGFGGDDAHGA